MSSTQTMRLEPDPEAVEFAVELRRALEQYADREALRKAWDSADGRIPGLWQRLAEMGAPGLVVPESHGGAGLDLAAVGPALIAAGRAGLPEPLTTTVAGAAILARAGGEIGKRWLPGIASGQIRVGLGLGPGAMVLGAGWSELLLVGDPADGAVHAMEAAEVDVDAAATADKGIRLARLQGERDAGTPMLGVDLDTARAIAVGCVAAELIGVSYQLMEQSVDYAKTREQFGQPIGSFQAIKHQLADVYVAIAFARPVVARALWSLATGQPEAVRDASHAMHAAATAARRAARAALQVHAGIGYTYEHDLHMWLKRTWTLTSALGDPAWHRERVAQWVLDR